ncbi:MAG: response regulator transcription factor [Pyramidobacter sp.]|nr:response regulator transcription factor [Pyramidobacter sp.]MBO6295511.1 response regulator transcription factor [Schwartzia sp. (in: firmicutes)]MBP3752779.1 response regulator transcription factor [Pyramidobacter sp.]MBP3836993.1 response regulator transcription factor [Pyramidobacter sp.]
MDDKKVRIFIAEDVEFVRRGLRVMIEQYIEKDGLDWQIVGEAATKDEAIEAIEKEKPDIALIDLQMPNDRYDAEDKQQNDDAGFEVIKHIQEEKLPTKVVVLTALDSPAVVNRARELKVDGFVVKSKGEDIRLAINKVLRGRVYLDPTQGEKLVPDYIEPLSEREKEVLLLTAVGLRQGEIAGCLKKLKKGASDSEEGSISERTVQAHMKKIYDKLALDESRRTSASAVETARRFGFITDRMIEEYKVMADE